MMRRMIGRYKGCRCDGLGAGVKGRLTWILPILHGPRHNSGKGTKAMAELAVEIGQAFHKADSHWIVWIVDRLNEDTEPVHVRLTMVDDPTTHITVSIDVLTDPRHFRRPVPPY